MNAPVPPAVFAVLAAATAIMAGLCFAQMWPAGDPDDAFGWGVSGVIILSLAVACALLAVIVHAYQSEVMDD